MIICRDEEITDYFVTKQQADRIQSFLMNVFLAEMKKVDEKNVVV